MIVKLGLRFEAERLLRMFLLVVVCCTSVRAVPTRPEAKDFLGSMLERELNSIRQEPLESFRKAVLNHPLSKEAEGVINPLLRGPEAAVFRRKKGLTEQQHRALPIPERQKLYLEFVRTHEKIRPELKAWALLPLTDASRWEEVFPEYKVLAKHLPGDIIPGIMLLTHAKTVDAGPFEKDWDKWAEVAEEVLSLAKTMDEKELCIGLVAGALEKLERVEKGDELTRRTWGAIRKVEPNSNATTQQVFRLNAWKALAASMVKDFAATAEYSKQSSIRVFRPMFLLNSGKLDEVAEALSSVRNDTTLSEAEREAFERLEPMILMPLGKFSEAREALNRLRTKPGMTSERLKEIELWESILQKWESGAKERQEEKGAGKRSE